MNTELSRELMHRVELDQRHRLVHDQNLFNNPDWIKQLNQIDADNTAWLKSVVDDVGWPTVSAVGVEASHAAWLLVQHADKDQEFQERCLQLMKQASPGEVQLGEIAYLEDRLLTSKKLPQIYGTQHERSVDGKSWVPKEMIDPIHVDQRRATMGLGPMAENTAELNRPTGNAFSDMPKKSNKH